MLLVLAWVGTVCLKCRLGPSWLICAKFANHEKPEEEEEEELEEKAKEEVVFVPSSL